MAFVAASSENRHLTYAKTYDMHVLWLLGTDDEFQKTQIAQKEKYGTETEGYKLIEHVSIRTQLHVKLFIIYKVEGARIFRFQFRVIRVRKG